MKRILLLILMFILFITPCAFAANGNLYENQQYKFCITFPHNWKINVNHQQNRIVEAKALEDYLALAVFASPLGDLKFISEIKLQEFKDYYANHIIKDNQKNNPTMLLIDKSNLSINNHDVLQIVLKDEKIHHIIYLFSNEDYFFTVLTMGLSGNLEADRKTIEQIISTLEFTD